MIENEMHCYEDYWIGHTLMDFAYANSKTIDIYIKFFKNFKNWKIQGGKIKLPLQGYECTKKWWEKCINTVEGQQKIFFNKNDINIAKEIRYSQDCGLLYIR